MIMVFTGELLGQDMASRVGDGEWTTGMEQIPCRREAQNRNRGIGLGEADAQWGRCSGSVFIDATLRGLGIAVAVHLKG